MKRTNGKKRSNQSTQKQGAFSALLDKPTRENSSGFAFSFAAMFMFGLSLIVSLVLRWSGFNAETDGTPDWYLYLSFALTPIALLLAAFWYFHRTKKSVLQTVKNQKCHWKYYLISLALQVGLFSVSFLNTFFADFLERLGYAQPDVPIPSLDGFGIVGVLLVVALLPAIFEEIIFRGVVLDGAYAYGTAGAALLCGGLFALYHQNPVQTVYQFCWGTAFALMAIRAGSIFPTMIAHFVNNAVIIILQKCGVKNIPMPVFIPVIIVSGLCLLGALGYLIFIDKNRLSEEEGDTLEQKKTKRGVFVLGATIGILICFVSWASALYAGFVKVGA
ncbi:MAG: CPBP family intramembrane metalloprotease [Clostridia bacterium]|nr:CPBP family intramembrane metalloprotease [Clostridia bacterium]